MGHVVTSLPIKEQVTGMSLVTRAPSQLVDTVLLECSSLFSEALSGCKKVTISTVFCERITTFTSLPFRSPNYYKLFFYYYII